MKVTLDLQAGRCAIKREEGDKPIYSETAFFYAVKKMLLKQGFDVIKKRPDKDGHMFSAPYYLRERKGRWCLYDNYYAVRDIAAEYRKEGETDLWFEQLN